MVHIAQEADERFLRSEEFARIRNELKRLSGKERRVYWFGKRLFDIVFSIFMLILLIPLFIIVSILICVDDPHGGILYSQMRVGRNGKPFRMWKFRSMIAGAEDMQDELEKFNEKDGPVFKIKDDPRMTRVGRVLRRCSIDELPQFFNVLIGNMSVVGPRPALPNETARYNTLQLQRLLVTPGLTCYWQTSDRKDEVSFDEWIDMDIQYIYERSWLLDLKLILRTIGVIAVRSFSKDA